MIRVTSLVENSSCRPDCGCIHGLSLYIETPRHRILFDMGPNALFLENAQALGVDISAVSLAFLSHGHYDHGGGLPLFLKRNTQAPVLVSPAAFGRFVACKPGAEEDIGLPPRLHQLLGPRLVCQSGRYDEEITVLGEIPPNPYPTAANATLFEDGADGLLPDRFLHEQSLLLSCAGKQILFAGCAHGGIVAILQAAERVLGRAPDAVFSGFHLTNPGLGLDEPESLIRAVGQELAARAHTRYYTGHCTGKGPYHLLKSILTDRLEAMPAGRSFTL